MGVIAALIHECGHIFMMIALSCRPTCIKLSFYGAGITTGSTVPSSNLHMILISAAGPLANIISLWMIHIFKGNAEAQLVHTALAAINLIPVFPLDGGQILHHLFQTTETNRSGVTVCCVIEGVSIFLLLCIGILLLFYTGYNFTLLLVGIYVIFCKLFHKWN